MRVPGAWMALVFAVAAVPARADSGTESEAFVGVFAHDVTFVGEAVGLGAAGHEEGVDTQIGVRTHQIESWRPIGRPRAYALLSINSSGDTSFVSMGLTWRIPLGERRRWYFQPGLGLAVHDGWDEFPPFDQPGISQEEFDRRVALRSERVEFGSVMLFQPELTFGYAFSDRFAVEASYVHLSNGQVFNNGKNEGMDDVGIRLVRRFGGQ